MLTYSKLGKNGRLGNQMFQYAALKGIARNNNYEFRIPFSDGYYEHSDHFLSRYFKLDEDIKYYSQEMFLYLSDNFKVYEEKQSHAFDEELFENCEDNTDLFGYFQTEKYFVDIKDEIYEDFTFLTEFNKPFDEYVSLHVRRGDYVNQPQNYILSTPEYYNSAIEYFEGKYPIVVVSDDINWCKNNIKADLYKYNMSQVRDLHTMSNATHNIMANSSFSWWGSWLNKNPDKVVIAPKDWYGPNLSHLNIKNLIPESWITM